MSILSKAISIVNVVSITISTAFFSGYTKSNPKFIWNYKRLWIAQAMFRKRIKLETSHLIIYIILQSYRSETVQHWHKSRYTNQGSIVESPDINLHVCVNKYLTSESRMFKGEKLVSSINDVGKTGYSHVEKWGIKLKVSFHSNPKEGQCQRMFKLLHSCRHFTWYQGNAPNPTS